MKDIQTEKEATSKKKIIKGIWWEGRINKRKTDLKKKKYSKLKSCPENVRNKNERKQKKGTLM